MSTLAISDADLLTLSDLNLYEFQREEVRRADGGSIVEQEGMLLTVAADPFPPLSSAMRIAPASELSAVGFLDGASQYFASLKRGFSLRARGHLDADIIAECEARGYLALGASPGMVLRTPLPTPAPSGYVLRVAEEMSTMRDFVTVAVGSYATLGLPEASAHKMMERAERMLNPYTHVVVAYREDQPVSVAMAFLSHGIGGVYWVGTLPAARGLGTAAHCTRAVGNHCFEQGARAVVLQASKQGEPIYRALGYEVVTRYPWFLYLPPKA